MGERFWSQLFLEEPVGTDQFVQLPGWWPACGRTWLNYDGVRKGEKELAVIADLSCVLEVSDLGKNESLDKAVYAALMEKSMELGWHDVDY